MRALLAGFIIGSYIITLRWKEGAKQMVFISELEAITSYTKIF